MVGRLVSCWNGLFPGAKLFVSESVYNPHFIINISPQLSARNLRKGQNLELTWWHQDDLLLPLVLPLLLTRCFKSMVPCSFDLIAFDQIAYLTTHPTQHPLLGSVTSHLWRSRSMDVLGKSDKGHKLILQSFWWRKILEMPYKVF